MMALSEMSTVSIEKRCSIHGVYTAKLIRVSPGGLPCGNSRCPACDEAIEADKLDVQQKQKQRQADAQRQMRHQRSRIPARFKDRRFENYAVENEGQRKALSVCQSYAKSWPKVRAAGTGLIFSGKAGTGKTHLACAIAFEVIEQGAGAMFATVSEVMRQIKSAFAKDSTMTEQDQINHFSGIDLLILDEVGMDYGTDFNKALIFEILNNRYENMLPTILLTNLDAAVLREYLGERLIDRMREGGGRMVPFTWDSYRSKSPAVQA